MDNKIILYFGTGDVTRLELNNSITENKIFAVKDIGLIDFNSSSSPLKGNDLIQMDNTKVCEETEKGWVYPLEKNVKITGKAAIKKNLIYFSSYLPNYNDLCMPGTGNLFEFSYSCGSLLKTVELKEGAPTGATIYKNNIYTSEYFNIDIDTKEAFLMAVMGLSRYKCINNNMPSVTGAKKYACYGKIYE